MLENNGLSANEQELPQSPDEENAIFEEIYKASVKGESLSPRQIDTVAKETREYVESKGTAEVVEQVAETTQEEATAEAPETTEQPAENQPSVPVVVKPEDYQAVLAEKAKWEQKAKSLDGREAARQREIAELKAKLAQQQQPAPNVRQTPKQGKDDPRWNALKEADPELAGLLEDWRDQIKSEATREAEALVNQRVEPIYQQQNESYAEREVSRLEQMIPNAREILEHPAYAEWYHTQPEFIQKAANESAESAAWVLNKYGYDMSLRYPQRQEQPKQEASQAVDPKVAQLQQEREKRVNVGQVSQKVVATPKQDTLDPEAYFKQVFEASKTKR